MNIPSNYLFKKRNLQRNLGIYMHLLVEKCGYIDVTCKHHRRKIALKKYSQLYKMYI